MAILQADHLVKRYGKTAAVDGISFTIEEGGCTVLLGPNGAGKTTTLNMLSGLLKPTEGRIAFTGLYGGDIRRFIGYLPQHPSFYNWMSGLEFVHYAGQLAGMKRKEARQRSLEILEIVGLKDAAKRKIGGYSGGMKQRLGIAQALIHRPRLLIMDEPVSALDPLGRREILELIQRIKSKTTILFSTHVLHDAEEISDNILIMRAGQIAVSGNINLVRKQNQQPVIAVKADINLEPWAERLRGFAEVEHVECSGHRAKIFARDLDKAKRSVLSDLASNNIPVSAFEVAETSLEDLFMEVVKG